MNSGNATASLELELAELAERSSRSVERRRQLLAFRLHLWNLIRQTVDRDWYQAAHGQTHYMGLINHLLDWQQDTDQRVLVCTFNYDALLDATLREVVTGWSLDTFASYIERDDFKYY
jgi:hypothetical protein